MLDGIGASLFTIRMLVDNGDTNHANKYRFGDNFAVIGSITGSGMGNYSLSWKQQQYSSTSVVTGKNIYSPVAYGTILVRILVKNNGTDLDQAQQLIDSYDLAEISGSKAHQGVAPLNSSLFAGLSTTDVAGTILNLIARTQAACFPFTATNPISVIETLASAGIYNGTYHNVSGVDVATAAEEAMTAIKQYPETGLNVLNNGWESYSVQGIYENDFVARSYVAETGYLALVPKQVIYPRYIEGNFSLTSDEAYIYTFSSKPPLGTTGWWSLTMYNSEEYLVDNPINVYSVGDRSNLTYPDGKFVYDGEDSSDKSFQILVQSAAVPPPSNWTHK